MVSALGYLCCLGSLLAAVVKVRSTRGTPMTTSRRYLVGALVAFSLAVALTAPASLDLVAVVEPIPNGTRLLANALAMFAAFCVLGVLDHSTSDDGRRRSVFYAATLVVSVVTMTLLLAEADTEYHTEFATTYGHRPLIITYIGIYLGYMSWTIARFVWLMRRYASAPAAHPLMRRGFRMTVFGASVGLVWVAWKVTGLALVVTTDAEVSAQAAVSQTLAVAAIGISAAGATYTNWTPAVLNPLRLLQVWIARRRLWWMWRQVIEAVPHVEFDSADVATTLTTLTRAERAEYRLYRRALEIRDAQLALRPYIPPSIPGRALETARRRRMDPVCSDVLLEAAELAAALDAHRAGHKCASESGVVVPQYSPASPNLMDEAAWLIRVSTTLRRSDLVSQLRERAALDRLYGNRLGPSPSV